MADDRMPYAGGYVPGNTVKVIDGTFVGMAGRVVSPEEAKTVQQTHGGQTSVFQRPAGLVWVVLTIFGSPVSVLLEPFQLQRTGES